jgi:hypothetical protein
MQNDALLGSWTLVEWTITYPHGRTTQPFGAHPRGVLIYSADGWMSAVMMRALRSPFTNCDMRRVGRDERARAFDEYLSYSGRYSYDGRVVRHDIVVSMNPLLIGTSQAREAAINAGELILAADEALEPSGETRRHQIRWRRAT